MDEPSKRVGCSVWKKNLLFDSDDGMIYCIFFLLFEENLEIKKIWLHENRKIQDQGTIVASDVTKNAKATSLRGADWSKKMDPHSPTSQVGCPDYLNFKVLHDVRMLIGLG